MAAPIPVGEGIIRRERRRGRRFNLDKKKKAEIVERVKRFYAEDNDARSVQVQELLERYAKYRLWRGQDIGWPWPGSSDQIVPDMMEASIRMQDTLHNAVMSARPVIVSRALSKEDKKKQDSLDKLHDTQFFVEQCGEVVIEEAAESFVNDPAITFFVPWVIERRKNVENRNFDAIPDNTSPMVHFQNILQRQYPEAGLLIEDDEGWDWKVSPTKDTADDLTIAFYTAANGDVEMRVTHRPVVFDGPRVLVKNYLDVICPPGVANLDIPGPSNPGGAPHVILRDRPTRDELASLSRQRKGEETFYDLVDDDDRKAMSIAVRGSSDREAEYQTDQLEGVEKNEPDAKPQGTLTRLLCFDTFDIDGDGETEDCMFWVILETETLLRVRLLTEMYPGKKPERPLASASYLPVGGRRSGISLLETMEGLHDFMKEVMDQMVDNGTLVNLPWGTYRASSNLKPETLRPAPGDLIPTNDPKNDIAMQNFTGGDQAFWLNLAAMIRQQSERLTLQGDLQAGRVPGGASSALRTLGGIQTLLAQGEARPERILRRFFVAFSRVFRMMHRLNRYYLPDEKKFSAAGTILKPNEDPWLTVARSEIDVDMEFDFHANVLNSSKQALQQGLQAIIGPYVSEIAIQLGISTPDTIYRLFKDFGESFGQDASKYLEPPTPNADREKITAEEAVLILSDGAMPDGIPAEPTVDHVQRIQEIMQEELFSGFPREFIPLLEAYLARMVHRAQQEQKQQAIAASAGGVGESIGPAGQNSQRQAPLTQGEAPLQANELRDETLPGAGGGGNAA